MNKFLKLEGTAQGLIKGSGKEDMISVSSIGHEISQSIDPSTGALSGKLIHKPLILIKFIDRSTPLLYKAFASGETMKSFSLGFYVRTSTGQEIQQFRIDLVNSQISSIVQVKQNSNSTPDLMKFAEYEEVCFRYQSILWSWKDGLNDISTRISY